MATEEIGNIRQILVEDEMRNSYLDYAMSVITARALPDVRDGLKPAQRRILVAMNDLNLAPNRGYRKCAKIAGDTSGNYHPHGSAGIAVGMATNMAPHNLSEVVDALHHLIENPDATIDELLEFIKGPDFPTGGLVMGFEKDREGLVINNIKHAYATGRGRVLVRARAEFEETSSGRTQIIVTELPYQVNKSVLQERIAELVRDKKVEGIAAMQDESDRHGMRLVIETKRDANPHTVLNHLYKHTSMQQAFGFNMLGLVGEQPQLLPLKRMLVEFLDYRQQVLTRRTQFELGKARQRAHILEGLVIALDNLDAVIRTIREAASREAARPMLMTNFALSEVQARAILEM